MKKDMHDIIYINEEDLETVKDFTRKAYQDLGSRTGDLNVSKAYVVGVINFLVKNKIIDNINIEFGNPGSVNNRKTLIIPE